MEEKTICKKDNNKNLKKKALAMALSEITEGNKPVLKGVFVVIFFVGITIGFEIWSFSHSTIALITATIFFMFLCIYVIYQSCKYLLIELEKIENDSEEIDNENKIH